MLDWEATLHQVTWSKDLVKLFNKAGHILSYDQILQVDTSLVESILKSLDPETRHSGQNDGWQEHFPCPSNCSMAESNLTLENLKPSTKHRLSVPESMEKIYPVAIKQSSPVFAGAVKKEWCDAVEDGKDSVPTAQATDMAFNI